MPAKKHSASDQFAVIKELVDKWLNGGPRSSIDPWTELQSLARTGTDLIQFIPDCPSDTFSSAKRYQHVTLLLYSHANGNRFDQFVSSCNYGDLTNVLHFWGGLSNRAPEFVPRLMPALIEHLVSGDSAQVKSAASVLSLWGQHKALGLWGWSDKLLPLLWIDKGVRQGFSYAYLVAEDKPCLEEVVALTHSKDAKARAGASALLAEIAIEEGRLTELAAIASNSNTSIRKGASTAIIDAVKYGRDNIGEKLMAVTISMTERKGRETIAVAVASGMESRFKISSQIKAAKKLLQSAKAEDRLNGAETAARLSADVHDCRMIITLLAQALFDEDEGVRRTSACAISEIADMQSSVYIVQATQPCIEAAIEKCADSEARAYLKDARRALDREAGV